MMTVRFFNVYYSIRHDEPTPPARKAAPPLPYYAYSLQWHRRRQGPYRSAKAWLATARRICAQYFLDGGKHHTSALPPFETFLRRRQGRFTLRTGLVLDCTVRDLCGHPAMLILTALDVSAVAWPARHRQGMRSRRSGRPACLGPRMSGRLLGKRPDTNGSAWHLYPDSPRKRRSCRDRQRHAVGRHGRRCERFLGHAHGPSPARACASLSRPPNL